MASACTVADFAQFPPSLGIHLFTIDRTYKGLSKNAKIFGGFASAQRAAGRRKSSPMRPKYFGPKGGRLTFADLNLGKNYPQAQIFLHYSVALWRVYLWLKNESGLITGIGEIPLAVIAVAADQSSFSVGRAAYLWARFYPPQSTPIFEIFTFFDSPL